MTDIDPFWKGRLFNTAAINAPYREYPTRADRYGPLVGFELETLPYADHVAVAIPLAPQAADDLRFWQDSWQAAFPGWETPPERPVPVNIEVEIASFIERQSHPNDAYTALHLERRATDRPSAGMPGATRQSDMDCPTAKTVAATLRSARMFRAAVDAGAYTTALGYTQRNGHRRHAIIGPMRPDGLVELSDVDFSARAETREDNTTYRILDDMVTQAMPDLPFWEWPFLRPFLNRTVFGVTSFERELSSRRHDDRFDDGRSVPLAGALADLAVQGEEFALVTPHEINGIPSQPLSIPLKGVSSIGDALGRLRSTLPATYAATVEKREYYTHARRYFFHGGRLIGKSTLLEDADPYETCHATSSARGHRGEWEFGEGDDVSRGETHAMEAASALVEQGIIDFALDIAQSSDPDVVDGEGTFSVLAVMELWSAGMLGFDPVILARKLRWERDVLIDILTDKLLDRFMAESSEFLRLVWADILELYGMEALVSTAAGRMRSYVLSSMDEAFDKIVDEVMECLRFFSRVHGLDEQPLTDHDDDVEGYLGLLDVVDIPFAAWIEAHEEDIALLVGKIRENRTKAR